MIDLEKHAEGYYRLAENKLISFKHLYQSYVFGENEILYGGTGGKYDLGTALRVACLGQEICADYLRSVVLRKFTISNIEGGAGSGIREHVKEMIVENTLKTHSLHQLLHYCEEIDIEIEDEIKILLRYIDIYHFMVFEPEYGIYQPRYDELSRLYNTVRKVAYTGNFLKGYFEGYGITNSKYGLDLFDLVMSTNGYTVKETCYHLGMSMDSYYAVRDYLDHHPCDDDQVKDPEKKAYSQKKS